MGQYYIPVITDGNIPGKRTPTAHWYSHDYDSGLKLMEHSYVGNEFVASVLERLFMGSGYLTWAGDYADNEPGT